MGGGNVIAIRVGGIRRQPSDGPGRYAVSAAAAHIDWWRHSPHHPRLLFGVLTERCCHFSYQSTYHVVDTSPTNLFMEILLYLSHRIPFPSSIYVLRLGAEGAPLLNPKYYPWIQNTILSSLILSSGCLYLEAPYLLLTRINSIVGVLFILYLTTRRFLSSMNFFTT